MANNRLFLVHRPSGTKIYLGKRMAVGWYDGPSTEVNEFFGRCAGPPDGQDDFCLAMEDVTDAPCCTEIRDDADDTKFAILASTKARG